MLAHLASMPDGTLPWCLHYITPDAFLVTSGNGTLVPRIVLLHGCHARIPAPE
jgi:hypothetical protein